MIRRFIRGIARLGALVLVVALLAGPVVVMAAIAGNPLDPDMLANVGQRADDETILKLLSLAFYVCWAWFSIPVLAQAKISLTNDPVPAHATPAAVSGPRGWLARLVRFALSSAAVATVTVSTMPTAAAIVTAMADPVSAAGVAVTELVADARERISADRSGGLPNVSMVEQRAAAASVVATDRDTPTSIALNNFPESEFDTVREQIIELNRGRPTPNGRMYESGTFGAGMDVLIPATNPSSLVEAVDDESDVAPHDPVLEDLDVDPSAVTVEIVEQGDHLWGLSEEKLDAVDGDDASPTVGEVAGYLSDVIDANPGIADPDLIYPDQEVVMPAVETVDGSTVAPDASEESEEVAVESELVESAGDDLGSDVGSVGEWDGFTPVVPEVWWTEVDTNGGDDAAGIDEADPVVEVDDVEADESVAAAPAVEAVDDVGVDDEDRVGSGSVAPVVAGLTGVPVLASALFLTWRRLRQRRRAASATTVAAQQLAPVEEGLMVAAQVGRVQWAGQQLAGLVMGLRDRDGAAPLLVEVSDLGVEVVWDGRRTDLVVPWESTAGGRSWRLAFDPEDLVPDDLQAAALPGLVSVGDRGHGGHTLVDLEAYGSLAVTGDPAQVESVLRAMVLEMGAGDEVGGAIVRLTSSTFDGIEHLDWVSVRSGDDVVNELTSRVTHVQAAVAAAGSVGAAGVFGLRVGREPTDDVLVAVVPNPAEVDVSAMVAAAQRRGGVAVVVAGDHPHAVARLEVEADGSATLWPAGIRLESVASVPRQVASEIAASFDAVATLDDVTIPDDAVWPVAVRTARREFPVVDEQPVLEVEPAAAVDVAVAESDLAEPVGSGGGGDAPEDDAAEPVPAPVDTPVVGDDGFVVDADGEIDLTAAGELLGGSDDEWDVPDPELLVSVLGPLQFGTFDQLRPRDVSLVAFMALNGHQATHDELRDAIWRGRVVSTKTIRNTMSAIRRATDDTLIVTGGHGVYHLDERVRTDLDVFTEIVANADGCSSGREMDVLDQALRLVRNVPFSDDTACEWSVESQHFSKACQMIEAAALRVVELAAESGEHEAARSAIRIGCTALRGNEPLYRALMDLNYRRGDRAAMTAAWNELRDILATLGGGPSQETVDFYEALNSAGPRI